MFVTLREEGSGNTWTLRIIIDGLLNNDVGAQSAPQVDVSSNGDVYVSFTYSGIFLVQDVSGNYYGGSTPGASNGQYDLAVVKFDYKGNHVWNFFEGNQSNDYITDLDYNENTNLLAIGGYVEGKDPLILSNAVAINPFSYPSTLGSNYPFGNAFLAVYEDNGSSANYLWSIDAEIPTYSTDVVTKALIKFA